VGTDGCGSGQAAELGRQGDCGGPVLSHSQLVAGPDGHVRLFRYAGSGSGAFPALAGEARWGQGGGTAQVQDGHLQGTGAVGWVTAAAQVQKGMLRGAQWEGVFRARVAEPLRCKEESERVTETGRVLLHCGFSSVKCYDTLVQEIHPRTHSTYRVTRVRSQASIYQQNQTIPMNIVYSARCGMLSFNIDNTKACMGRI